MSLQRLRTTIVLYTGLMIKIVALAVTCLFPLIIASFLSIVWLLKAINILGKEAGPWPRQNIDTIIMITALLSVCFAAAVTPFLYKMLCRVPLLGNVLRFSDNIIATTLPEEWENKANKASK